ncbi:MAG TPA: WbqC family protein [Flavobacteriales bacterium]|nr:WbqC family protein [Flavobacteriales bacterium]
MEPNKEVDLSIYGGKRLGIMQPYFFPYLGYFGLIANTDLWIVFDPVQYIRKGWVNRNRVLKPGGGWKYVSIPVAKHSRETLIKEMHVAAGTDHFDTLVRNLDHYRSVRAPHYKVVIDVLAQCYEPTPSAITPFIAHTLAAVCAYIGIDFHHEVYSEMNLEHEAAEGPGDWALNICKALGVSSYLNPPGGQEFFEPQKFANAGVDLIYHHQDLPVYDQRSNVFESGLSIIDVMMFNEPAAILGMLDGCRFEKAMPTE